MIVVRNEQLATFLAARCARLVEAAVTLIREHFPHTAELAGSTLRTKVSDAISRAVRAGLQSDADLLRYVCLAGAFGWHFADEPRNNWMVAVLSTKRLTDPSDRMTILMTLL